VRAISKKFPVKALATFGASITKGWLTGRSHTNGWKWRDTRGGSFSDPGGLFTTVLDTDRGITWALGWEGEEADALRVYRGLAS
jgi:hypothetical protein